METRWQGNSRKGGSTDSQGGEREARGRLGGKESQVVRDVCDGL